MSFFERYLALWISLCIVGGIALGKIAPDFAARLDRVAIYVDGAPVVSNPIALCLFFMKYPIMVKFCLRTQGWFRRAVSTARVGEGTAGAAQLCQSSAQAF